MIISTYLTLIVIIYQVAYLNRAFLVTAGVLTVASKYQCTCHKLYITLEERVACTLRTCPNHGLVLSSTTKLM